MRIGHGYDIHRFGPGRRLILGGIEVPHTFGLVGHSDADVVVHAIIEGILGALGLRDIGSQFPDTDPKYKDISSLKLLEDVMKQARQAGRRIVNVDVSLLIEKPKIAPFVDQMRSKIADVLDVDGDQVSIKARTNEGLGEIGRGEAAAAHAVVLVD